MTSQPDLPGRSAGRTLADSSEFVRRHYRRNFAANLTDGGLFMLGAAFFSASTILPLYVAHLTSSPLLIALLPAVTQAGWFLPQLLTVPRVQRLRYRLPYVMRLTANERFPVPLLALSIVLWPAAPPAVALAIFFVLCTWQSVGGGVTAPGWVDLIARVIPTNRRGRLLGMVNLAGSATGVAGAALAGYFLRVAPYPLGFAYTFAAAGAAFLLSWAFLGLVREPPAEPVLAERRTGGYWSSLPVILREQPNLRRYLLARVPGIVGLMGNGFFVVYAVERFRLPDEAAAGYTAALMIAGALANPLLGLLGDRYGQKLVMELHLLTQAAAVLVTLLAGQGDWFYLVFSLQGISNAASLIALVSLPMEFGDEADRPVVAGLINTSQGIFFMVAPLLGGALATLAGYRATFWLSLVALAVALVAMRRAVVEPRHAPAPVRS